MGSFKSYQNLNLERQIAEIEKELTAYKATQAYGAQQIQSRTAIIEKIDSVSVQVYSQTYHYVMGRVTFSGVNKDKLARGALTWTPSSGALSWYMCEASDSKALYEMKWYILIQGNQSFNVSLRAYMNMNGKLTYESVI